MEHEIAGFDVRILNTIFPFVKTLKKKNGVLGTWLKTAEKLLGLWWSLHCSLSVTREGEHIHARTVGRNPL